MIKSTLFAVLITIFILVACDSGDDPIAIFENLGLHISNNETIVIAVPVNGCSPCIAQTLAYLNSVKNTNKNCEVILIGTGIEKELSAKAGQYKNIDFIFDKNGSMKTSIDYSQSPILFKFEDKKLTYQMSLNETNYKNAIDEHLEL